MSTDRIPPHLPQQFMPDEQYRRLYGFSDGMLDHMPENLEWNEMRIRPGLTANEVFRKLPSAADFEYGGYLTKTRIRYAVCDPTRAYAPSTKPCTFHSHPTDAPNPDMPSVFDVYAFLKWRYLRMVTVGRDLIWVMDKTRRTATTIRKLADWEAKNMVSEMGMQAKRHPEDFTRHYMLRVIKAIGVNWPSSRQPRRVWPALLRDRLQIKVTVLDRV